jgi:hypothetical protein
MSAQEIHPVHDGARVGPSLPPPGFAGGINGSTYVHSSSVRSLGYLR